MAILVLLILALILYAAYKSPEQQAHHYLPPAGMKTDWGAMQKDIASGMPKREIDRKIASGSYNIPDKR